MSRDYKVSLEDILEAAGKVRDYTEGLSQTTFAADPKTLDAVVRNLEVIGEAVKKIPDEIRSGRGSRSRGVKSLVVHSPADAYDLVARAGG